MDTSKTYITMCNCDEVQMDTGYLLDGKDFRSDDGVWLPRQDQLQEMVDNISYDILFQHRDDEGKSIGWIIRRDKDGNEEAEIDILPEMRVASMEQLWLAFVMKENHNKVWGGEKFTEEE